MNKLKKNIESSFDHVDVTVADSDRMTVRISKEGVIAMLSFLKNAGYDHLALISCVDFIDAGEFELVYVVSAYMEKDTEYHAKERRNILVKTRIPRNKARFMTIIDIFENAEPYERELHELFGIHFEGHPRLKPLFLEISYQKPPFRKDFDTRQFVKKFFDRIPAVE
jgi:NADH-quinone oxidoreductase subunit C